jgi:putative copper export protein
MTAAIAPALEATRLTLHVLAAAVWVGGQVVVAGLVPTARALGEDAPRRLARAFARISWPAYGVLLATGAWNVIAVGKGQGTAWQAVLAAKVAVVVVAGVAALMHSRSRDRKALAAWGAVAGTASVAALAMGALLAG